MMAYLIVCRDNENSLNKRLDNRSNHLEYLKKLGKKLILAGPILDKQGNPCGSILVLSFTNREDVDLFIKNDPYSKVNLFGRIEIINFKKVL